MEREYSANVVDGSREFTAREKIQLKDTNNMIGLDSATQEVGTVRITPVDYAIIEIHNERSDNKDYKQYVIIANDGQRYYTGSESLFNAFSDIYSDMCGEPEPWEIEVYRKPSKNRQGKDFLTCSLI